MTVDASLDELLCPRGVGLGTIKEEGTMVSTDPSDPSVSHTKRCSSVIVRIHDTLRSRPLSQCSDSQSLTACCEGTSGCQWPSAPLVGVLHMGNIEH